MKPVWQKRAQKSEKDARFLGRMACVLPAAQTSNPPRRYLAENRTTLWGALALAIYALIVGWGLIAGWIGLSSSYFLMALPCLVPVAWYMYGFLKPSQAEPDFGLLLSTAGWALLAFGLLVKDSVWRGARDAAQKGVVGVNGESAPAATVCFVLAFIAIVTGAMLSYNAWRKDDLRDTL